LSSVPSGFERVIHPCCFWRRKSMTQTLSFFPIISIIRTIRYLCDISETNKSRSPYPLNGWDHEDNQRVAHPSLSSAQTTVLESVPQHDKVRVNLYSIESHIQCNILVHNRSSLSGFIIIF
jgi:hypothetical protein